MWTGFKTSERFPTFRLNNQNDLSRFVRITIIRDIVKPLQKGVPHAIPKFIVIYTHFLQYIHKLYLKPEFSLLSSTNQTDVIVKRLIAVL